MAPVQITVTGMILGIAATFLGPAIYVFSFSAERQKKITKRSLIVSVALIVIGLVCSRLHLIGARIEIILGVLIFAFFYGSLTFKGKYDKWKKYARTSYDALFLSLFDFVGIGALILGFLFKIQHWPMAQTLIIAGIVTLAVGVLAWNQKFKREVVFRKEAEDQLKLSHMQLEEKQKEIIDSINYAKRIQQSHMPTEKYIETTLKRLKKGE